MPLTFNLLPHQQTTLNWMKRKETGDEAEGGVIAFAPGLGKTALALALMDETEGRTLLVVPATLRPQWVERISETGLTDKTLVITYETVRSKIETEKNNPQEEEEVPEEKKVPKKKPPLYPEESWTRVVFDEAHYGRNPQSKTRRAMFRLSGERRVPVWCLTGTPIVNKEDDLQSLFAFTGNSDIAARGHVDIQEHLPRLQVIIHRAQLTKKESDRVRNAQMIYGKGLGSFPARRIAGYSSTKRKILRSIILSDSSEVKRVHRFLVFFRIRKEALWIKEAIADIARVDIIDGRTIDAERHRILHARESYLTTAGVLRTLSRRHSFMIPNLVGAIIGAFENRVEHKVVIIHAAIGSVGLNLQRFDNVVYPTPEWSPMDFVQGTCRIYRWCDNPNKLVRSHRIVTHALKENTHLDIDTLDEQAMWVQRSKEETIREHFQIYFGKHETITKRY